MQPAYETHFADDYESARAKFLSACEASDAPVKTIVHPLRAPDGGQLATDYVYFGERDAGRILVLTSGVHGPELFTGSGCQTGLLAEGHFDDLPAGVGVLIIHAANPWGAAHLRRNNEDNVDLCRNFVDFDAPPFRNADYDNIKSWLPRVFMKGPEGDAARAAMEQYKKEHGDESFGRGFMAGQYHDAQGVSFGGVSPVWSRKTLESLWRTFGANAERICFLDYHSGLGPYGYGTMVCLQTGEALQRADRAFGKWILAPRRPGHKSDGKAPDVQGHTTDGHERAFNGRDVVSVVIEYGVEAYEDTGEVLMLEHRTHHDPSASSALKAEVKERLLRCFYPKDRYWRRAIFNHSLQSVEQAIALLTEA